MILFFTLLARRAGLLLTLLLGLAATTWAQAPSWQAVVAAAPANAASSASVAATATAADGSVYVAGSFRGLVSLGGVALAAGAGYNVFVAKWSPATSSFVWAQQSTGSLDAFLTSLAVSGSSVYVAGYFRGTAAFGGTSLTSAGAEDAFVVKLADAGAGGAVQWAQRLGGPAADRADALAASGPDVYAAGSFTGTAAFGSTTLTSTGSSNVFLTKLTDAGTTAATAWARAMGSATSNYAAGVAAEGGSVYVAAPFAGTATFGALTLSTGGQGGLFVAKLTDAGSSAAFAWVRQASSTVNVSPRALGLQGNQVYVAGSFQGTAAFGSLSLLSASTSSGTQDAFVARLTDAGAGASWAWALGAGGPGNTHAIALAAQANSLYVAGGYRGTAGFGGTALTSQGTGEDAFVARLTDAGTSATFAWALSTTGPASESISSLLPTATGLYVGGIAYGPATFGSQTIGSATTGSTGFFATLAPATGLATSTPAAQPASIVILPTPAPAGARATVQLPAGLAAGPATFTLLDGLGRTVRTRTASLPAGTTAADLDVAGLAPGVYALRVAVGERLGTARLVVE